MIQLFIIFVGGIGSTIINEVWCKVVLLKQENETSSEQGETHREDKTDFHSEARVHLVTQDR